MPPPTMKPCYIYSLLYKMSTHQISLLFGLLSLTLCSFQVYSPSQAQQSMPQNIHFTIANFGHIPYGTALVARLVLSEKKNLCEPDEKLAELYKGEPYFVLGERGDCKFTTKALNAQKSGAKLAVIEDLPTSKEGIIMANDGYGFLVEIPSIFISNENGEKLKDLIRKHPKGLMVAIKFQTSKTQKALLNFWLDPTQRHSFVLVRDFAEYYNKISSSINVELYYKVMQRCTSCEKEDCLAPADWCVIPRADSVMTGKNMIEESLKQYFILKNDTAKWFQYVDKFDKECTYSKGFEDCSLGIMKDLGLPIDDIKKSVQEHIKKGLSSSEKQNLQSVLNLWVQSAVHGNILFFPDVSINNINYQGQLVASDIFEMVCNSLIETPSPCSNAPPSPPVIPIPQGSLFPTIILIIVLMTVGFLVLVVIYRRVVRREMKEEMSAQVNQMVSQYISFYDKKEGSTLN